MFHCKNEKISTEICEKILRKAFQNESVDKKLIYKTDFKVIWLYLFGYKISKVKTIHQYFLVIYKKIIEKIHYNYYTNISMNYKTFLKSWVKTITMMDYAI